MSAHVVVLGAVVVTVTVVVGVEGTGAVVGVAAGAEAVAAGAVQCQTHRGGWPHVNRNARDHDVKRSIEPLRSAITQSRTVV